MSIRALSRLLGRSTIDPEVAKAYEDGHLAEILADYDFSPETRRQLEAIEADTFHDFAAVALGLLETIEADSLASVSPDPRQGLGTDAVAGGEEQAA
jgi:hypothetical protein